MMLTKSGGVILADGVPIKWCGANAYSIFSRLMNNGSDTTYRTVIDMLADAGVKLVRIFGDGYNAAMGMGLFETNAAQQLTRMGLILDYLASKGMGAIWCVHWNVGETANFKSELPAALVTGGSACRDYLKLVVDTVVPAYKDHPALAAWSIGNELQYGTALLTLTLAERYALAEALRVWIVTQDTSARLVISDFAEWYPYAGATYDAQATNHAVAELNFTTWSSHIYTSRTETLGVNGAKFGTYIDRLARLARGNGKPLVVGEFGPDSSTPATNELQCNNLAAGWRSASNAQLALWWNCDVSGYSGNQANVFFNTTEKPYILEHLRSIAVLPYNPQPLDATPRASLIAAGVR